LEGEGKRRRSGGGGAAQCGTAAVTSPLEKTVNPLGRRFLHHSLPFLRSHLPHFHRLHVPPRSLFRRCRSGHRPQHIAIHNTLLLKIETYLEPCVFPYPTSRGSGVTAPRARNRRTHRHPRRIMSPTRCQILEIRRNTSKNSGGKPGGVTLLDTVVIPLSFI
jgi:hypothetical protein